MQGILKKLLISALTIVFVSLFSVYTNTAFAVDYSKATEIGTEKLSVEVGSTWKIYDNNPYITANPNDVGKEVKVPIEIDLYSDNYSHTISTFYNAKVGQNISNTFEIPKQLNGENIKSVNFGSPNSFPKDANKYNNDAFTIDVKPDVSGLVSEAVYRFDETTNSKVNLLLKDEGVQAPDYSKDKTDILFKLKQLNKDGSIDKTYEQKFIFDPAYEGKIRYFSNIPDMTLRDGTVKANKTSLLASTVRGNLDIFNPYLGSLVDRFNFDVELLNNEIYELVTDETKGNVLDGFTVVAKIKADKIVNAKFVVKSSDFKKQFDDQGKEIDPDFSSGDLRIKLVKGNSLNAENFAKVNEMAKLSDKEFLGFYAQDKDGKEIKFTEDYKFESDMTFTAKFAEAEGSYTIGATVLGLNGKRTSEAKLAITGADKDVPGKFNDNKQWLSDAQVAAGTYTITVIPPADTKAEIADGAKGLKKVGDNKFELVVNGENQGTLKAVYAQFKLVPAEKATTPEVTPTTPSSDLGNKETEGEYTGFYTDGTKAAPADASDAEKTVVYEKKYAKALPKTSDLNSAAPVALVAAFISLGVAGLALRKKNVA